MKFYEKHDSCKQNLSTRLCLEAKSQKLEAHFFAINQQIILCLELLRGELHSELRC